MLPRVLLSSARKPVTYQGQEWNQLRYDVLRGPSRCSLSDSVDERSTAVDVIVVRAKIEQLDDLQLTLKRVRR